MGRGPIPFHKMREREQEYGHEREYLKSSANTDNIQKYFDKLSPNKRLITTSFKNSTGRLDHSHSLPMFMQVCIIYIYIYIIYIYIYDMMICE